MPIKYNYSRCIIIALMLLCISSLFYVYLFLKFFHRQQNLMRLRIWGDEGQWQMPWSNWSRRTRIGRVNDESHNSSTSSLLCQKALAADPNLLMRLKTGEQQRVVLDPGRDRAHGLAMDCQSIRQRRHFPEEAHSAEELQFPVALARIVYRDYEFLEAELAASYQPQNLYCYVVDAKAAPAFRQKMRSLARCLPNVLVPDRELDVYSSGQHVGLAYLECMKALAQPNVKWEYMATLNNHDLQVKSNRELVQIYKWLGGASDIHYSHDFSGRLHFHKMIADLEREYDWSFRALRLFRNDTLNHRLNAQGKPLGLRLHKGYVQSSLARAFVDFLVHQLDLTEFFARLDTRNYAADELIFQTLAASDDLNAPGGFTSKCQDQRIQVPYATRYSIWRKSDTECGQCMSCVYRHEICLMGMEDLTSNVLNSDHLFVNKLLPSFDYGAIQCWHQEMRRRALESSREMTLQRLDPGKYRNWPQTLYQNEWQRSGGHVNLDSFKCKNE